MAVECCMCTVQRAEILQHLATIAECYVDELQPPSGARPGIIEAPWLCRFAVVLLKAVKGSGIGQAHVYCHVHTFAGLCWQSMLMFCVFSLTIWKVRLDTEICMQLSGAWSKNLYLPPNICN